MRNVPPLAANYIQRAGRAGRRTDSTAFALTFAQRRSHDLTHYREPWRMVSGKIVAPHFKLENEKIIRRHVYATALSDFFKKNRDYFKNVETFFFREDSSGPTALRGYLKMKPQALLDSLERIVPESLHNELDISGWGWVETLLGEEDGLLEGVSGALDVERRDIDGCLYTPTGSPGTRQLILFDDVPGGAGHVRRIANEAALYSVLEETLHRLSRCDCGSKDNDTSCYECLRNYRNQFCHDELRRRMVVGFVGRVMA